MSWSRRDRVMVSKAHCGSRQTIRGKWNVRRACAAGRFMRRCWRRSKGAIAQAIVGAPSAYAAGKAAAFTALQLLREAHLEGRLQLASREVPWLDRLQRTVEALPDSETDF